MIQVSRRNIQKRGQLFVTPDDETLSVAAMRVNNPIVRPHESKAETQPQLQPAFAEIVS
jgi:hypothetical protein